jgi:hypothetical protein
MQRALTLRQVKELIYGTLQSSRGLELGAKLLLKSVIIGENIPISKQEGLTLSRSALLT